MTPRRGAAVIAAIFFAAAGFSAAAGAQQSAIEPVFARARQLVANGNGTLGRLVIDSLIAAMPEDSPAYGDALYWRGALAATSSDAERDYRRVSLEHPLSAHAGDAIYQLAQLESARGDRAAASRHLESYLRDYAKADERPRAVLLLVRLLLEQNELPRGCGTLRETLSGIPAESVELRHQLEYYLPRCSAADVSPGGAVPVAPESAPAAAARDSARPPAAAEPLRDKAKFTLQVAAYRTRAEAAALVRKLAARKLEARIVAAGKLYRVRIGRFATRAAAVTAQKELRARKIDAFVTELGPDDK